LCAQWIIYNVGTVRVRWLNPPCGDSIVIFTFILRAFCSYIFFASFSFQCLRLFSESRSISYIWATFELVFKAEVVVFRIDTSHGVNMITLWRCLSHRPINLNSRLIQFKEKYSMGIIQTGTFALCIILLP